MEGVYPRLLFSHNIVHVRHSAQTRLNRFKVVEILTGDGKIYSNLAVVYHTRADACQRYLHIRQCGGDVGKQTNVWFGKHAKRGDENVGIGHAAIPVRGDPAPGVVRVEDAPGNVRAVALVDGNAVTLGDKSD